MLAVIFAIFPRHGLVYPPDGSEIAGKKYLVDEGRDGVVESEIWSDGSYRLFINGSGHDGRSSLSLGLGNAASYLGTMDAMDHSKDLRSALVVGLGSASTLEPLLVFQDLHVTVVEINQTLLRQDAKIPFFRDILSTPTLELQVDDVRRFLYRNPERRFDLVIVGVPIRPTWAYSNNLYSAEFLQLAKSHLTPNGLFTGLVESNEQIRTIRTVFPYVRMYCSFFAVASSEPFQLYRDVAPEVIAKYGPAFLRPVDNRRQRCTPDISQVSPDPTAAVLRDHRPVMEYYLGRRYRSPAP
jgi:hypothetical protein